MVPTQKSSGIFYCKTCDYSTSRKSQYQRHLDTAKHQILQNPTSEKFLTEKMYVCECGKSYKHSSTLYAHKKNCTFVCKHEMTSESNKKRDDNKDDLIIELLKQNSELIKENSEFKNIMIKAIENGTMNNSHNTTHTNSHNKAFNLNFFLNETCKNAMNITEFVDSIKLQLSDLEKFGEVGYVEGLSNIIVKSLSGLDETIRPIHCTDKKRETMYIKDADKWEKEDDNRSRLRKVVKKVADKNIRLLPKFREKYPDYGDSCSKTSDIYNKMVIEAMTTDDNKDEKVIHNISKVTTIKDK